MTEIIPTKADTVFKALMAGRSFNRFEAERSLHDHCLHSTVAQLQKAKDVAIDRKYEKVRGYQGMPTSVCRYWITKEERKRIIDRSSSRLPNKEALDPTRQDKEKGLNLNTCDDTDRLNKSQEEPRSGV
jgi:hypothetical protein